MKQPIEKTGAGEGNRTLVISLEGIKQASDSNAQSDKTCPFGPIEATRGFGTVRTPHKPRRQRARGDRGAFWPLSVFDGQTLCGLMRERAGGQYEAASADGQSFGLFTNMRAAASAVWREYQKRKAG